jgi:hypothetical protein
MGRIVKKDKLFDAIEKDLKILIGYATSRIRLTIGGVSFNFGQVLLFPEGEYRLPEMGLRFYSRLQVLHVPKIYLNLPLQGIVTKYVKENVLYEYRFFDHTITMSNEKILNEFFCEQVIKDIYPDRRSHILYIMFDNGFVLKAIPGTVKENTFWLFANHKKGEKVEIVVFKRKVIRL